MTPTDRGGLVRTDLALVLTSSVLVAAYLLWAIRAPAQGAEPPPPADTVLPEIPADAGTAPWVREGEPVPARVLYTYSDNPDHQAPSPPEEAKHQSWHNRILFPSTRCPYCGRRVPTRTGSYWFLLVGFFGQIAFTGRFLVQWIASERAKASVVPVAFWWLSIAGSLMLLVYAISILAWPIILGQAPNCFIYGRNLYFIRRQKLAAETGSDATAQGD